MGKTIIQQARGHGSKTYQVRPSAYVYRIGMPKLGTNGKFKIISLLNSSAHTSPLAKILIEGKDYFFPAAQGLVEGQEIEIGSSNAAIGNIISLKDVPTEASVFNIEIRPGDGGRIGRTSGNFATVVRKEKDGVILMLSSKKEKKFNNECRAIVGMTAGQGRMLKPIVKAGKKWHMMKARNKLWPRTSALKFNAVDHPFGGGRGKRIKSKIAKRNAPAGARVGHLRPNRTGHLR
jgi:large subunit ribosomal protein L2